MKKRIFAALMAALMVVGVVGCGKKDNAKDGKTSLTMWCIATESDSNRKSYELSIADFEKAHPEINFTWEAVENQAYKTKIKAAVSANEMPDIFFTWSCAFLGDFVEAGRVYCVDEVYAQYKKAPRGYDG